jgi:hypothetical protein
MPRYFLDLPEEDAPRPWDPRAGPLPVRADTRYFGAVFRAMEPLLRDRDLDFHLTWDVRRLPGAGARTVAVVLGDESGRIPAYAGRVRAVFKGYGAHPSLAAGARGLLGPGGPATLAQFAVRWLRWLPGGAAHAWHAARRLRGGLAPSPVAVIPIGTFNQLDLPLVPISQRDTDLFFAGSVEHADSLRGRLSPKAIARREMVAAVDELARRRAGLRADLRLTPDFGSSEAGDPDAYSRALMNAKVCLAPRGTSVETFRFFEGLRYGCVVVSERLPGHPFYRGGPQLELGRWRELAAALEPVLDDPEELARRHSAALAWWRERCSEAAVARFMAERLNALAS